VRLELARASMKQLLITALIAWLATSCASEPHRTVFDRMVAAVNDGDAEEYAGVYAENAVISIYGANNLVGRSAIEQHETELLKQFPGAQLALYSVWRRGNKAVVRYAVNAHTAAGEAMGHEGLLFYQLDDAGLIASERRYLDSLTPMAQLGALGPRRARMPPVLPATTQYHDAGDESLERANSELVLASLASWVAGERTELLARIHLDANVDELMLPQPFRDPGAAAKWSALWSSAVHDLEMDITDTLAVGDTVLVEMVVRGKLVEDFGPVAGRGRPFTVHRGMIARVKDGKLAEIACFMNGRELAQAVGQWPTLLAR
jgi:uncharacterized protein (TIGR02246 family)